MRPILLNKRRQFQSDMDFSDYQLNYPHDFPEIVDPKNVIGWAIIEMSQDNLHKEQVTVAKNIIVLAILLFLVGTLMIMRINRILTVPIGKLAEAARPYPRSWC